MQRQRARPGKSREAKVDGNLWRVESFQSARWYGQRLEFDRTTRRCCMIQLRREWGRFSNFSFRTPQRRISAYPARPSG